MPKSQLGILIDEKAPEFKGTEIVFLNERTISFYTVYYHDSGDIYSERYSENLSCQLNTCQL
jgi:hypothetical protein